MKNICFLIRLVVEVPLMILYLPSVPEMLSDNSKQLLADFMRLYFVNYLGFVLMGGNLDLMDPRLLWP